MISPSRPDRRTTEDLYRTTIALGARVGAATVAVYVIWGIATDGLGQLAANVGLGPSISRQLARLMNGDVAIALAWAAHELGLPPVA
jgi:hypothetical protein